MDLNQFGITQLTTGEAIRAAIRHHLATRDSWLLAFSPVTRPEVDDLRRAMIRLDVPTDGVKLGRMALEDADTGEAVYFGFFLIPKANLPAATFAAVAQEIGQPIPALEQQAGCIVADDPSAIALFYGLLAVCRPAARFDPSNN